MGEKAWKRTKKRKTCPDCGATMIADALRVRCTSCAKKRQRQQVRDRQKHVRQSRKTSTCTSCGERFRQATKTHHQLCSACREGAEPCPRCGHPLRGKRTYRACDACYYVTETTDALAAVGLTPQEPWPGYGQPWAMTCTTCGSTVHPTFANIKRKGTGCTVCGGNVVTPERLQATLAHYNLQAREPWPGSATPWKVHCLTCDRDITVSWASIYNLEHQACPYCSGVRVDDHDVRDYMITHGQVRPLVPYKNAKTRWKSECLRCGAVVYPTYDRVKSGFGACSNCAQYGFRADDPTVLYVLHAPDTHTGKIGITNTTGVRDGTVRIRGFRKFGFTINTIYEFPTGWVARDVEKTLLTWIRDQLQVPPDLSAKELPNGWSETFAWEAVPIASLRRRLAGLARTRGGRRIDPESTTAKNPPIRIEKSSHRPK